MTDADFNQERPVVPSKRKPARNGESFRRQLDLLVKLGSVTVIGVGIAVIIGWWFGIAALISPLPGFATMKFNTAVALVAAGVSLLLLHLSRGLIVARLLAAFIVALTAVGLAQYAFAINLGIDQLLLIDTVTANHPGRMSPSTAAALFFIGLALLALKSDSAFARWTYLLVLPSVLISALAIVGYAYGVNSLYEITTYATTSLQSALATLILSLTILAADQKHGLTRVAISDTAGGVVCRRLLPAIPLVLFLLGWLQLAGQHDGLYDATFGVALMVILAASVVVLAIAITAVGLHNLDRARQRAETEIVTLNALLEARVAERTHELAETSAKLRAANRSLERLSHRDELTGLANRRAFDSYLDLQIGIARRRGRELSLVLCDVDSFKAYNDHYGHTAGDNCLRHIAEALQACCFRPGDMVARYGGEEFAIILPETDLCDAEGIAEKARRAIALLRIPHAHSPAGDFVSISGGVASLGRDAPKPSQLINDADQSLYEAKGRGRNRIVSAHVRAA